MIEEVVDVLREKVSYAPVNEPNQGSSEKPTIKKIRKRKKQASSHSSFINKRSGRLISRSLRNQKQDHLSSISVIEVNDHCFDDEINDFLA
jgi:BRCT domain type II-containing protein